VGVVGRGVGVVSAIGALRTLPQQCNAVVQWILARLVDESSP
jgi:hypothetical protein